MKVAQLIARMRDDEEQSYDEALERETVTSNLEPLEVLRNCQTQHQDCYWGTVEQDRFQDQ